MFNLSFKHFFKNINFFEIDNIVKVVSILYICVIDFRIFNQKSFSLADIIFPLLLAAIFFRTNFSLYDSLKYNVKSLKFFHYFAILWFLSFLLPSLGSNNIVDFIKDNFIYIAGSIYLIVLLIVFLYLTIEFGWEFIFKAIFYAGLINALIGLFGLCVYFIGIDNNLVTTLGTSSNYLIGFPRIKGFSLTPNGYAYPLYIALVSALALFHSNKISKLFVLQASFLILTALFFTFSKVLLLILLLYTLFFLSKVFRFLNLHQLRKYLIGFTFLGGLFLYVLVTHIMVVNDIDGDGSLYHEPDKITKVAFIDGQCEWGNEIFISKYELQNIHICPSLFVELKLSYFNLGLNNFLWGVGAKNNLNLQNPHSTYLERFYLHGLTGILSLTLLIYLVGNSLVRIRESNLSYDNVYYVFYLFWLISLIMAINDDLLRYRLLWVMIATTMGIAISHSRNFFLDE